MPGGGGTGEAGRGGDRSDRPNSGRTWPMRLFALFCALSLLVALAITVIWLSPQGALRASLTASVPSYLAALFLWWHVPGHPVARRLLLIGGTLALALGLGAVQQVTVSYGDWFPVATTWTWVSSMGLMVLDLLVSVLIVRLVALLPDGRPRHRHERLILRPLWAVLLLPLPVAAFGKINDQFLVCGHVAAWLLPVGGILLVVRYLLDPEPRWRLRFGLIAVLVFGAQAGALLLRPWLFRLNSELWWIVGQLLWGLPFAALALVVVIASVRHRLLGVDVLVSKTALYGLLWSMIGGWYIAEALTLGFTVGQYLPLGLAVAATVAAMLIGQPLRSYLTRLAARRVFGPRVSNFELLVRFGTTLEHAFDPHRLAPRLAAGLKDGLAMRWVEVELDVGAGLAVGVAGQPDGDGGEFPVRHGDDLLGVIRCRAERPFTDADRDLVATLARQAALAVHNTRLTAELSARLDEIRGQARELDASRARILHAQDTERRRIERQLHDGIQQELVALVAKLRLARNQLGRDGDLANGTFTEVQDDAYRIIDDLREFAHGIHPPILSDQGLVAAVSSSARRLPIPVAVVVADSLRDTRFAVDVEETAFFLISEALTNVLKHAEATAVTITLSRDDGTLGIAVRDDGVGFVAGRGGGFGLTGMRDRIDAAGGALRVESRPGHGTTVHAELPDRARETADA